METNNIVSQAAAVSNTSTFNGLNDSARLLSGKALDESPFFSLKDSSLPRLTVLMTADAAGGVLVHAVALAQALRHFNVTVILAAMGGPLSPEWKARLQELDNVRCFESDYKLEWMEDCWTDVKLAGQWLMRLADRFQPDIVHLNNYVHASLNWPCPSLLVGHSCVYSWYRDVQGQLPSARWKKYHCGVASGLRRADFVTAPTWSFLRSLRDLYGSFRSAGAVYNGVDAAPCQQRTKEQVILAVGRLGDQAKNIEALKKVQPLVPVPIYLAGSVDHPDDSIADCGILRHLGFLDRQRIGEWYARAAVYVLPAIYEPFGLSALEAAHAGCALVLGDIPSLREIWANAALFVDPRDPEAIARSLNRLMTDHLLRAEYAARAKSRALLYPVRKMAERYYHLYKMLLKHEPIYSPLLAASIS